MYICTSSRSSSNRLLRSMRSFNNISVVYQLSSNVNKSSHHLKNNEEQFDLQIESSEIAASNVPENREQKNELQEINVKEHSLLEPCKEDISSFAPYFVPSFNFAAYINKSQTLQELFKLGVDLHKLEKKKGIPQFVLKLDFNKDIKDHIRFLHDVGVEAGELGLFITKNPLIFKEDLDVLRVRINYLESKKFTSEMVSRIVSSNPYWLMFSTQRIDARLGHFQETFNLSGSCVRALTVKQPRLITYNMRHIRVNTFVIKEELGFTDDETKSLLLQRPRLWMINQVSLKQRFDYVHNIMKIPHAQIAKQPEVLGSREFRIKQRHMFLQELGQNQYDPQKEGYVSMKKLVSGTDADFCRDVAKATVHTFNAFLKTL